MLGVRESRRIVGEYTVSLHDILTETRVEDAVANVAFNADLHTKTNKGQKCFSVKPYQIPLRALITKGFEGILVAGRRISGEREAMVSYRVTANCTQMGEFTAYAVAEAKNKGLTVRDIQIDFSSQL